MVPLERQATSHCEESRLALGMAASNGDIYTASPLYERRLNSTREKESEHTSRLNTRLQKRLESNTEMGYFTFIKLPCAGRSHEAFDDLTESHENDHKKANPDGDQMYWGHSYLTRCIVYIHCGRSVSTQ